MNNDEKAVFSIYTLVRPLSSAAEAHMTKREHAIQIAFAIAKRDNDPDLPDPEMVGDFTDDELTLFVGGDGWWWDEIGGKWEKSAA